MRRCYVVLALAVAATLAALLAVPAGATSAGVARGRLVASPSVVPAAGGRVRLRAYVQPDAPSCLFSSPLNGLVAEFLSNQGCEDGHASATAALPPQLLDRARDLPVSGAFLLGPRTNAQSQRDRHRARAQGGPK